MGLRRDTLLRSALLGAAGGGRSQSPLAAVALTVPAGERHRPASWLSSERATGFAVLAAVTELGLDKLPVTPSRISGAGLIPRVLLSGWAAAALAAQRAQSEEPAVWALPTAVAAGTAVVAALAGARWRAAVHHSPVPDWIGAVVEDAVVLALAAVACRPPKDAVAQEPRTPHPALGTIGAPT
ncbi:DUF4126 family protein [Streptacidiphilus sp. PAMC 29251]